MSNTIERSCSSVLLKSVALQPNSESIILYLLDLDAIETQLKFAAYGLYQQRKEALAAVLRAHFNISEAKCFATSQTSSGRATSTVRGEHVPSVPSRHPHGACSGYALKNLEPAQEARYFPREHWLHTRIGLQSIAFDWRCLLTPGDDLPMR
ncbi:hypothetical protein ACFSHT_28950 [Paraburkholderia silviterrae]|uniref:Uncharacterized protein n=1 Tax=Paraburkholderia silviterrae TaxID=2528715 RepID=A0A4V2ZYM3_9BURK|nr:hypothetical protein [Paraburkholderia silviterrae]TDG21144.1 hypothetical protein EYW47_22500 [Paraburkholderia silviterrae]